MNAIMDDEELEPQSHNNFDLNDDQFERNQRDDFAGENPSSLNQNALQSLDRRNQQIARAGIVAGLANDPATQQKIESRKQYQALLDSGKIKDEKKKLQMEKMISDLDR